MAMSTTPKMMKYNPNINIMLSFFIPRYVGVNGRAAKFLG